MYKIIGADQKEYGPVTADQVLQWVAEGRANGRTLIRFEDGPWKPLSTFPEFASAIPAANVPPPLGSAPPPGAYAYSTSAMPTGPRTPGITITGFILSILGLLCCGPVFSTIGLVLSIVGLVQANQKPDQIGGRGLAIAGIAIAVIGYVLFGTLLATGVFSEAMKNLRWPPH